MSRARLVYSSRGKPRSPLRWSRGTRDEDRQMCRIVRGFCNVCLLDTSRVKTRQNVKRSSGSLRDPDPRGAPQAPPRTKIQKLDESGRAKSKNEKRVNQNPNLKSAQPLALPTQLRRIVLVQAGGLGRNEVERLRPSPGGAWPPSRRRAVVAATPCYSSLQPLFKGGRFEISGAT